MPNGGFVSFYEFNDFLITGDDAREVNPLANGPLSARTGLDITFTLPPGSAGLQMIEVRDNDPRFEDDFQESRRLGPCNQSVVDDVFIDGGRTQIAEAGDFLEVEFTILVEDPDGNQARLFFAAFTTSSAGDDAGSLTMVFSDQMLVPGVEYSFVRTQDGGGVRYSALVNCFAAGTLIETPAGPRAVETLAVGDLVRTADGRDVALRWTGTQHLGPEELARQPALRPVRIAAGAFGPGRPARDLVVSPQHRIVVDHWRVATFFGHDAVLAPAKSLIDGARVAPADAAGITYCHLMFDAHEIVLSEGLASESLFVGDMALDAMGAAAREEIFAIFPELRGRAAAMETALPVLRSFEGAVLAEALR